MGGLTSNGQPLGGARDFNKKTPKKTKTVAALSPGIGDWDHKGPEKKKKKEKSPSPRDVKGSRGGTGATATPARKRAAPLLACRLPRCSPLTKRRRGGGYSFPKGKKIGSKWGPYGELLPPPSKASKGEGPKLASGNTPWAGKLRHPKENWDQKRGILYHFRDDLDKTPCRPQKNKTQKLTENVEKMGDKKKKKRPALVRGGKGRMAPRKKDKKKQKRLSPEQKAGTTNPELPGGGTEKKKKCSPPVMGRAQGVRGGAKKKRNPSRGWPRE